MGMIIITELRAILRQAAAELGDGRSGAGTTLNSLPGQAQPKLQRHADGRGGNMDRVQRMATAVVRRCRARTSCAPSCARPSQSWGAERREDNIGPAH
jgi:hypothetical protein